MKERIIKLLNVFIWAMVLVFVGDSIVRVVEYIKYPEMFAGQSAPWYSSILFFGIVTAVVVGICLLFKWILKKRDD